MNPYGVMGLFKNIKNVKGSEGSERMAELLLTRFTHDLAGPIGAVVNGLDFVMNDARHTEDPGGIEIRNQAIDIIEESSKQSLARLQSYRMAYGVVYTENAKTSVKEVMDILKSFFHKTHIELSWNPSTPEDISALKRRILVGMVLSMSRILIYGGKITVGFSGENKNIMEVRAYCQRFKEPEMIKDIFHDRKEVELDVDNVPYFFIKEIARTASAKINFDYKNNEGEKTTEFTCELPL